jgi:hypothetical protein
MWVRSYFFVDVNGETNTQEYDVSKDLTLTSSSTKSVTHFFQHTSPLQKKINSESVPDKTNGTG